MEGNISTTIAACSLFLLRPACAMTETEPTASSVSGTATYRERIALPPDAVFEATLENVARADVPADVIARTRMQSPGQVPIRFTIPYDLARIDASGRYGVRARILHGDNLLFTTTEHYPALAAGAPAELDIMLRRAGTSADTSAVQTTERLRGRYSYMADAGWFTDCASGERLPVAQEGDNAALEAAYGRARRTPGEALLAVVDGHVAMRMPMEGRGPKPTLVVERFVEIVADGDCASAPASSLENTYWKLVRLGAAPVTVGERQREPHMNLQPGAKRVVGSGGCNRFTGGYTLEGDALKLAQIAGTMMACVEGMEQEQSFYDALGRVVQWRITGEHLEVFDGAGDSIAQFAAVYLR